MPRAATVTKAQLARAMSVARETWGDAARVVIKPDRSIVIERGEGPDIPAPARVAPGRKMVL
jgi:hypothetical protein